MSLKWTAFYSSVNWKSICPCYTIYIFQYTIIDWGLTKPLII